MAFGATLLAWEANSYGSAYTSGIFSITGSATGSSVHDPNALNNLTRVKMEEGVDKK